MDFFFSPARRLRHRHADHLGADRHLLQHHPVLHPLLPVRLLRARAPLGVLQQPLEHARLQRQK